jgi:hypothetical protein
MNVWFTRLNMREICGKMVSKILNDDQKTHKNEVKAELLGRIKIEPYFLNWAITSDEPWFFE